MGGARRDGEKKDCIEGGRGRGWGGAGRGGGNAAIHADVGVRHRRQGDERDG
jgi:hypothetical protein